MPCFLTRLLFPVFTWPFVPSVAQLRPLCGTVALLRPLCGAVVLLRPLWARLYCSAPSVALLRPLCGAVALLRPLCGAVALFRALWRCFQSPAADSAGSPAPSSSQMSLPKQNCRVSRCVHFKCQLLTGCSL